MGSSPRTPSLHDYKRRALGAGVQGKPILAAGLTPIDPERFGVFVGIFVHVLDWELTTGFFWLSRQFVFRNFHCGA